MGFLDSVQSSFNRGVAGASRTASTVKLKAQMTDALKRRQGLAAQLGASLYELTRNNPEFRAGREAIYDGIAAIDAERAQCQAEIDRIEAESQAAQVAASYYTCPFCGSQVGVGDLFCAGCGKSMAEIKEALAAKAAPASAAAPVPGGPTCPSCGAPVNEGDMFCMNCGHKFETPVAEAPVSEPVSAPVPESVSTPEPAPTPMPESQPEPDPIVEPVVVPEPTPAPAPVPEPVQAPAPAPAPEPTPAPESPAAPVCPECGAPVSDGDLFCMSCGHKFGEPAAPVAPAPASASSGRVCPTCGTANKDTDKFCMSCGTKLV